MEVEELRESGNENDSSVVKAQFFSLYDKQFGHTAYVFYTAVLLKGHPERYVCIVLLVKASSQKSLWGVVNSNQKSESPGFGMLLACFSCCCEQKCNWCGAKMGLPQSKQLDFKSVNK